MKISRNMVYTQEQISNMKREFISLLRSTNRNGIENVINWLENQSDFFTAPASASYHGSFEGGLLSHSLNVYKAALKIRENMMELALPEKNIASITDESVIIATLLHDVCKTNFYSPKKKMWKDETQYPNQWRAYQSYEIVDKFPLGHGEKSVIMLLSLGLSLTGPEICAIRWHMGMTDPGSYLSPYEKPALMKAINDVPIVMLVAQADAFASFNMEKEVDQKTANEVPLN